MLGQRVQPLQSHKTRKQRAGRVHEIFELPSLLVFRCDPCPQAGLAERIHAGHFHFQRRDVVVKDLQATFFAGEREVTFGQFVQGAAKVPHPRNRLIVSVSAFDFVRTR
ncbi:MAG TPA: hypothetical protein PKX56_08425, partial [Marmoricola sp.]|nr:hypothetical protein [Marmoricola sp.]